MLLMFVYNQANTRSWISSDDSAHSLTTTQTRITACAALTLTSSCSGSPRTSRNSLSFERSSNPINLRTVKSVDKSVSIVWGVTVGQCNECVYV